MFNWAILVQYISSDFSQMMAAAGTVRGWGLWGLARHLSPSSTLRAFPCGPYTWDSLGFLIGWWSWSSQTIYMVTENSKSKYQVAEVKAALPFITSLYLIGHLCHFLVFDWSFPHHPVKRHQFISHSPTEKDQ